MTDEERAVLIAGQARLEGKIETMTARLDAHLSRTTDEIRALFAKSRETAAKVEDIRVDYVPKDDFETHKEENREDLLDASRITHARIEKLDERIGSLSWKVASASGGLSLLITILGLLVKWMS